MKKGLGFVSILIIIGVGIGLYYFLHHQQNQELLNNPSLSAEKVQQSIVAKVGQLIELPTNEQPTIATISDITKLQNQPFFHGAKNGEIVLLYPKAKEAILYNPETNKVVKMGPINISAQQQSVGGASTSAATGASSAATPTASQITPQQVKQKK